MKRMMVIVAALAALASPALAAASDGNQGGAASDRSIRMSGDRMTSALNLLEAKGYTNFTNFKSAGAGYTATVNRNGRDVTIRVNPDSETVTPLG